MLPFSENSRNSDENFDIFNDDISISPVKHMKFDVPTNDNFDTVHSDTSLFPVKHAKFDGPANDTPKTPNSSDLTGGKQFPALRPQTATQKKGKVDLPSKSAHVEMKYRILQVKSLLTDIKTHDKSKEKILSSFASEVCANVAVKLAEKLLELNTQATVQNYPDTPELDTRKKTSVESEQFAKQQFQVNDGDVTDRTVDFDVGDVETECQNTTEIYDEVGLSGDTLNELTRSNLPLDGNFIRKLKETDFSLSLPESWQNLPVLDKRGYRSYGGDWTNVMEELLRKHFPIFLNPYCVWKFVLNFVKQKGSRKKASPFFRLKAKCTIVKCPCVALFSIQQEQDNKMHIHFEGNICHDFTV